MTDLARTVEALLFLSTDPVTEVELIAACECGEEEFAEALAELKEAFAPGARGLELRELAGGWTLATAADTENAARRLLSKPRTPPLSPAQAETLAIIAYLQPVSRPEITRIRGVSADSAAGTLLERGLIEESGRSPFGAVLYRTTPLFLKLFGMASLDDLPEVEEWDPSPEEEADLRERLLRAGEARAGSSPTTQGMDEDAVEGDAADPAAEGLTPAGDAEAEAEEGVPQDATVGEVSAPRAFAGEPEGAADEDDAPHGVAAAAEDSEAAAEDDAPRGFAAGKSGEAAAEDDAPRGFAAGEESEAAAAEDDDAPRGFGAGEAPAPDDSAEDGEAEDDDAPRGFGAGEAPAPEDSAADEAPRGFAGGESVTPGVADDAAPDPFSAPLVERISTEEVEEVTEGGDDDEPPPFRYPPSTA